jgi:hypothetical protein
MQYSMGIVQVYPLNSTFHYDCACGNHIAKAIDLRATTGECVTGQLFTFIEIHNFYQAHPTHLQVSHGESVFLVDDYPLWNEEIIPATCLYCKVCSEFLGWKTDTYMCFSDKLLYQ